MSVASCISIVPFVKEIILCR